MSRKSIEITDTGWITTFQDLGRQDTERLGVPTGGAADQHSAAVANLLVGNRRQATLIESLGGELAFIPDSDILVAVTGAPSSVTVGNTRADSWTPVVVPAGHEVRVSDVHLGTRTYVAINGAIIADAFLGSAAPDSRMGFSQVIARGSRIRIQSDFQEFKREYFDQSIFRLPVPVMRFDEGPWTVDVLPTADDSAIRGISELIASSTYTVTDRSNHVGLRLNGPVLHPEDDTEVVSHGVPIGALEIPHADELIILGRYRSLTAGYPIVGFASRTSLPVLGQAGPGRDLVFRWIDHETSVRQCTEREGQLRALESAVDEAFGALGFANNLVHR